MPSLNVALAWATPVDIAVLRPNLEAYVDLQPTLNALRLCHRFGGLGAPITRLPIELLNSIEDIIVDAEREQQRQSWLEDYACFHQTCHTMDHYTDEELSEYADVYDEAGFEEMSLEEFIMEDSGLHHDVHYERVDSWRVKMYRLLRHEALVKKHFGLSLWTTPVRLESSAPAHGYFALEATLAYLRLPDAPCITSTMEPSQDEDDDRAIGGPSLVKTGCAVAVSKVLSRPDDTNARFKRAMRILNLTLSEHETQKGLLMCPTKPQQDSTESTIEEEWPRLLTLVSTTD